VAALAEAGEREAAARLEDSAAAAAAHLSVLLSVSSHA
jgi:hypothetical protein